MKTVELGQLLGGKKAFGRICRTPQALHKRAGSILIAPSLKWTDIGYSAVAKVNALPDGLHEGDVVKVDASGSSQVLWEVNNTQNGFLLTEACNCRCLMCPQPPKAHDPSLLHVCRSVLALSGEGFEGEICITGGEPTLLGDELLRFLHEIHSRHPLAWLLLLTNAKGFADLEYVKRLAALRIDRLLTAVSMHADTDILHDEIVGRKGSFISTQRGITNLGRLGQKVEIRIVASAMNQDRLPRIAEHVYRNFPFAAHVTFMGLEMTGLASGNVEKVWVDPWDYRESLDEAVRTFSRRGMHVSVYNHPLCILKAATRPFARRSISAWKNCFPDGCRECARKDDCCGFFSTSSAMTTRHITPL